MHELFYRNPNIPLQIQNSVYTINSIRKTQSVLVTPTGQRQPDVSAGSQPSTSIIAGTSQKGKFCCGVHAQSFKEVRPYQIRRTALPLPGLLQDVRSQH